MLHQNISELGSSYGTDIFPLSLVYQPACECLGDSVDGCRVVDQRPFKRCIVAKGHDTATRDVSQKLLGPEEAGIVVGLVRPCLFRIAVQAVEEDVAGGESLVSARVGGWIS
jgi:hypothetical protein